MSDREKRLVRSMARIAVAIECLHAAGFEAGAVREDVGKVIEKAERSLKWAVNRLQEELREDKT